VEFEPTISAGERSQTYALDRKATGTGNQMYSEGYKEVWRTRDGDSATLMASTKPEADLMGFANFLLGKAMKGVWSCSSCVVSWSGGSGTDVAEPEVILPAIYYCGFEPNSRLVFPKPDAGNVWLVWGLIRGLGLI